MINKGCDMHIEKANMIFIFFLTIRNAYPKFKKTLNKNIDAYIRYISFFRLR